MKIKDIKTQSTDYTQEIYNFFSSNNFLKNKEAYRTPYSGTLSSNSYNLGGKKIEEKRIILEKFFDISNKELFKEKYYQAVSGSGNEWMRITVMHSSSLCALLCFYNVKNKNIKLQIGDKKFIFNDSIFEWENVVTKNGGPSSVDVVLIGRCLNNNKKVFLFLESKFSEYFKTAPYHPRVEYKSVAGKFYNEETLKNIGIKYDPEEKDYKSGDKVYKGFTIKELKGTPKKYNEGVKQMISHYIGIMNLLRDEKKKYEKAEVYLGSIVFNFGFKNDNSAYEHYCALYRDLAKKVFNNDNDKPKNFKILDSLLTYQEVFNYNGNITKLDPNVAHYYFPHKIV